MSDTPETDQEEINQTQRFGGYMVKSDFARNLERQRNMLLDALEGLMEWEPRLKDEPEFKAYESAREAIASVKQNSPYAGKES